MNDLKFVLRQLVKNPGLTVQPSRWRYGGQAVAVLTLAPGWVLPRSAWPANSKFLFGTQPPDGQAGWHDSNHRTRSFGLGVEAWVAQQAADKVGRLVLAYGQYRETVAGMTEPARHQSQIAREERRTRKGQQEGKDFFIGHAFAAKVEADLSDGNFPAAQHLALAFQDIFVQDVHTTRGNPARLHRQLMGVFPERLSGRTHRFRDGFFVDVTAPLLGNAFPGCSSRHLLQHVGDKNSRASKRGLTVANIRVTDDIAADNFLFHGAHEYVVFADPSTRRVPKTFNAWADLPIQPFNPFYKP